MGVGSCGSVPVPTCACARANLREYLCQPVPVHEPESLEHVVLPAPQPPTHHHNTTTWFVTDTNHASESCVAASPVAPCNAPPPPPSSSSDAGAGIVTTRSSCCLSVASVPLGAAAVVSDAVGPTSCTSDDQAFAGAGVDFDVRFGFGGACNAPLLAAPSSAVPGALRGCLPWRAFALPSPPPAAVDADDADAFAFPAPAAGAAFFAPALGTFAGPRPPLPPPPPPPPVAAADDGDDVEGGRRLPRCFGWR